MAGALSHLKVLDLSRVLAGPWATQVLADMGADVVKVERPGAGDDTRAWGPPFLRDASGAETGDSNYFLSANRGKRSITVDLSSADGQEVVRALARKADIVVENYKVGTLARYGLAYEDLRQVNPRLVYCSITGFGQDGPYADLPGYDFIFQGMSGLMSITGQPLGTPGDEPMKSGIAMSDIVTGMYACTAILAAIAHRDQHGVGQFIDVALLDCTTAITSYQALNFHLSGKVPQRLGNAHPNMVPYQVFACEDADIIVAVGNDTQFRAYCRIIGRPDLAQDDRFRTVAQRNLHRATLIPMLADIMRGHSAAYWMEKLEAWNVPCGPINDLRQVFEDPQIVHRQMLQHIDHAAGVPTPLVASPLRFSETPVAYDRAPPVLGEHTDEVLNELGFAAEEIASMRSRGSL